MGEPHVVTLRATRAGDLDALFAFEQHEEAVRMAAFTAPDPTDRATFDAHWRRLIDDPNVDFAKVAQGLGVYAEGPITNPKDLGPALQRALAVVKKGEPALVDVVTQPR